MGVLIGGVIVSYILLMIIGSIQRGYVKAQTSESMTFMDAYRFQNEKYNK